MAEEQQSKNIGELFVEFGAKGLPTLLKGLNGVSAQFLLTKNAAEKFTKPLINMSKEAGKGAVGIAQLSSSLGTTLLEAQKFQLYFQKHNLSEGLLGDLASTADMLTKVRMGIGGISGEFAYAMNRMGLSWTDYDGSIESIEQLVNDVQNATKNMDGMERRIMLQGLGWSPEWSYAFDRGINLSDALALSDDDIKKLEEMNESLNEANIAIDKLKNTTISKSAPLLTQSANVVTDMVTGTASEEERNNVKAGAIIGGTSGVIGGALMGGAQGAMTGGIIGSIFPGAGNVVGGVIGGVGGAITGAIGGGAAGTAIGAGGGALYAGNKRNTKGDATGFAVPLSMQNTAHIPPNLSNSNTQITITNENRVNVANPQDVGTAITSINNETLQNIEYNQYQISNRPGL